MPLTLYRSLPSCVISLPTLVIAGRAELGQRVVDLLAQLGVVDVDVAPDFVEGHRRAVERDYSAVVLAGKPARRFGFQRFCAGFGGHAVDPPAMIQIADGPVEPLPCAALRPYRLEPDFEKEDLRRAVWASTGRAGVFCKSAGLCAQTTCALDPATKPTH